MNLDNFVNINLQYIAEKRIENSSSEVSVLIFVLFLAHLSNKWDLQWKIRLISWHISKWKTICCLSSNHLIASAAIRSIRSVSYIPLFIPLSVTLNTLRPTELFVCIKYFWINSRVHFTFKGVTRLFFIAICPYMSTDQGNFDSSCHGS